MTQNRDFFKPESVDEQVERFSSRQPGEPTHLEQSRAPSQAETRHVRDFPANEDEQDASARLVKELQTFYRLITSKIEPSSRVPGGGSRLTSSLNMMSISCGTRWIPRIYNVFLKKGLVRCNLPVQWSSLRAEGCLADLVCWLQSWWQDCW